MTDEAMTAVIDECEHGHKFAKLPDHPKRDGLARCPHCMAAGLTLARQSVGAEGIAALKHEITMIRMGADYTGLSRKTHAWVEMDLLQRIDDLLSRLTAEKPDSR